MPLPEEVINRLSEDRAPAAGWSSGLLSFAGAVLGVTIVLYAGIVFGYEPYLNSQNSSVSGQLNQANQTIKPAQEASLVNLYSQISHVKGVLASRTVFSPALTWLAKNTEVNVYYSGLTFSAGNQLALTMYSKSETDLDEQVAIFENDPDVLSVNVSSISISGVSGYLQSNVTIILKPSLLTASQ